MITSSHSSVQHDEAAISKGALWPTCCIYEPEFHSRVKRTQQVVSGQTADCRLMDGTPTFIIDPLERDGLLLGNAAHGSHLLTQLHKGYCCSQVCDQHVPECRDKHTHTHIENVKIESLGWKWSRDQESPQGG